MGVPTVGQLTSKVIAGDASELIKIAEAFHENKLAQVAGCVAEANRERGVRLVLISGPSSSGKTTFAKRLGVQHRVLGLNPVLNSLDTKRRYASNTESTTTRHSKRSTSNSSTTI